MRILFFGDVVGLPGMKALEKSLRKLIKDYDADFVIVNGENASRGKGLTERDYLSLLDYGADCITLGNHYHSKKNIDDYIDDADNLVRPLNLKDYGYGSGSISFNIEGVEIRVTNILGEAFMKEEVISPIKAMENLLEQEEPCIHIVDFHGESTSEKKVFASYFDGRVSAVLGTHTHVQTNDAQILKGGSAFCSDVGMCGDPDGIIGFDAESVINKIVLGGEEPFMINDEARMMVNGIFLDIDEETYLAKEIKTINRIIL